VFWVFSNPYTEKVHPKFVQKKPYRSIRKFRVTSLPSNCRLVFSSQPVFSSRIALEYPNSVSEIQIWPQGHNTLRSSPHGKDATHERESTGHWRVNTKYLKGNCQASAWSNGIPQCGRNLHPDRGENRPKGLAFNWIILTGNVREQLGQLGFIPGCAMHRL
jgi:hypothetical protein